MNFLGLKKKTSGKYINVNDETDEKMQCALQYLSTSNYAEYNSTAMH